MVNVTIYTIHGSYGFEKNNPFSKLRFNSLCRAEISAVALAVIFVYLATNNSKCALAEDLWPVVSKNRGQKTSGWWFGSWILFVHILGITIPTDFHIFQRGIGIPPTSNCTVIVPFMRVNPIQCDKHHKPNPILWGLMIIGTGKNGINWPPVMVG